MNLLVSSDRIGEQSGGGQVTYNELLALQALGEPVAIINPSPQVNPFETDELALQEYNQKYKGKIKLAHFYAGTYSKLIRILKADGVYISYTAAAHDIQASKEEFARLGFQFNFPHLVEPDLWEQYVDGCKNANLVICPSTYSKTIMEGYGCKNVKVIPHGCYTPHKIANSPQKFVVGYLGSVCAPDKGILYLVLAWAKLAYKDALLILAGKDSPDYIQWLRAYGKGAIYLAGWQESASAFYNQISLLVVPSVTEGFNCEVLEAMAHARPVICSVGAGAVDLVMPGVTGQITSLRDVDAIANFINDYKNNPAKRQEHGTNAKEISSNYTWDKVRELYSDLWRSCG